MQMSVLKTNNRVISPLAALAMIATVNQRRPPAEPVAKCVHLAAHARLSRIYKTMCDVRRARQHVAEILHPGREPMTS